MKKKLSLKEAVHAGQMVYALNTDKEAVICLATRFSCLDCMDDMHKKKESSTFDFLLTPRERFLWEWRAFVHAAVMHGLSKYAPAIVVVEYLRTVQSVLQSQYVEYSNEMGKVFIDEPFSEYIQAILEEKRQNCPSIFFKRMFEIDIKNEEDRIKKEKLTHCLAGISSTMAMLFAASEDAFEKFDYALE